MTEAELRHWAAFYHWEALERKKANRRKGGA